MLVGWRAFIRAWRDYPLEEGAWINGRYQVLSVIGMGSYGLTYCCLDGQHGTAVLLKQAKPSRRKLATSLLAREQAVLRQLEHPYIPACRDYFEYQQSAWLVTDYVEGETLEQQIFEQGRVFTEPEVLRWALRLLDPIAHVHSKGYVHLDLRIPNVMICDEEVYLIDFGLARNIGDYSRPPDRMPPEIDSDLEDAAHLMLFMLYSAYEPQAAEQEGSWREELKLSASLELILCRLLKLEGKPYVCAEELIQDLEKCHRTDSG
ncbi:serine/threonine protein kinase [Paenibacillus donghaensis]|uniref:Protein kinase domain-containing protein n=1 Tax=Paenibacillus donghaensis TaxID=414771 RepID=A0A2Z2K7C1_9BACL|nr:protein kinase [Paenibacillus donghaensis]ASA20884.1 hypothetical protein B9T62_08870 [Paenibacillus donghaensis]